jgi:hypothetical protein
MGSLATDPIGMEFLIEEESQEIRHQPEAIRLQTRPRCTRRCQIRGSEGFAAAGKIYGSR